jgi:hypothetical protein
MNEIDEWREAKRWRLLEIFYAEEPIWKDEDHAELKDGAAEWVRKMRAESEARFERIQRSSGRAGTKNAPTPLKTPGPVGWQAKAPALLGADVGQALSPANPNFPHRVFITLWNAAGHGNALTVAVRFRYPISSVSDRSLGEIR